jgi:hypothetical protein
MRLLDFSIDLILQATLWLLQGLPTFYRGYPPSTGATDLLQGLPTFYRGYPPSTGATHLLQEPVP